MRRMSQHAEEVSQLEKQNWRKRVGVPSAFVSFSGLHDAENVTTMRFSRIVSFLEVNLKIFKTDDQEHVIFMIDTGSCVTLSLSLSVDNKRLNL